MSTLDPRPHFLTLPWIAARGDQLIADLVATGQIRVTPLPLEGVSSYHGRHALRYLATRWPSRFAAYLEKQMLAIPGPVHGILLTHDWPAPMQLAVQVARAHGLPSFVVTHEALFIEEALYYTNPQNGLNVPQTDHCLVWNQLQRRIFAARGYPVEHLHVMGSPKLSASAHIDTAAQAQLRAECREALGVPQNALLISHILQPLDNVRARDKARQAQWAIVKSLAQLCQAQGWQLALRLPPGSNRDEINQHLLCHWPQSPPFLLVEADDTRPALRALTQLAASDVVTGYASTMLLEAALMGKPVVITATDLPISPWEQEIDLPVVRDTAALAPALQAAINTPTARDPALMQRIADVFSDGQFRPDALEQIATWLSRHGQRAFFLSGRARLFGTGLLREWDPGFFRFVLRFTAWGLRLRQKFLRQSVAD